MSDPATFKDTAGDPRRWTVRATGKHSGNGQDSTIVISDLSTAEADAVLAKMEARHPQHKVEILHEKGAEVNPTAKN